MQPCDHVIRLFCLRASAKLSGRMRLTSIDTIELCPPLYLIQTHTKRFPFTIDIPSPLPHPTKTKKQQKKTAKKNHGLPTGSCSGHQSHQSSIQPKDRSFLGIPPPNPSISLTPANHPPYHRLQFSRYLSSPLNSPPRSSIDKDIHRRRY